MDMVYYVKNYFNNYFFIYNKYMIYLFDKLCLFNYVEHKIIIYGQYKNKFTSIKILPKIKFNLVFSNNDFYIEIFNKIDYIDKIIFMNKKKNIKIKEKIILFFPFEKCDLSLSSNSIIISTICKDYSSRLKEWIEYNLNLGFSGIIIFDNDENKSNKINESYENLQNNGSIKDICEKYKGKVWRVECNYQPIKGNHWNTIQRITLHIGVNAFRNKCGKIALIDADEFIYIPKNKSNIIDFLSAYKGKTINIKSNILTNKANNDIINNNILDICLYVGENKYTKIIIDTSQLKPMEFINTPHKHSKQIKLNKCDIIHYHCWVNSRYLYNNNMLKIEYLKNKKYKN